MYDSRATIFMGFGGGLILGAGLVALLLSEDSAVTVGSPVAIAVVLFGRRSRDRLRAAPKPGPFNLSESDPDSSPTGADSGAINPLGLVESDWPVDDPQPLVADICERRRGIDPSGVRARIMGELRVALNEVVDSERERIRLALRLICEAVCAERALLLIPAPAPGRMCLVCSSDDPVSEGDRARSWPVGEGLPAVALESDEPVAHVFDSPDNATTAEEMERLCPYPAREASFRGVAVAPFPVAESARALRGVVVVEQKAPALFSDEQLATLRDATSLLGWLTDVACRLRSVRRRAEQLEVEVRATHALSSANEPVSVCRKGIEYARILVPLERALVALFEGEEGYRVVVAEGFDPLAETVFAADGSLAADVGRKRIVLPSCGSVEGSAAPICGRRFPISLPSAGALAVVPLCSGEALAGVMVVYAGKIERYSLEHRLLLHSLGDRIGAELIRRRLEISLDAMARTDPLTGLPNRRDFQERIEEGLLRAKRYEHTVALLLIDIDLFKVVNDRHGHVIGDDVLRALGRLLRGLARDVDIPARLGGDELALLLEHTDQSGAMMVAERLRKEFATLAFEAPGGSFKVTLSVGAAVFPFDAQDEFGLMAKADTALYEAKRTGRNRVVMSS